MKIGMRTIKTALAVTISVSVCYLFNLESPFFAGIASIITMQGNLIDSYQMGKNRMLGTILGATLGLVGAILWEGNPILIGLGIVIVIYICNKLNWNKSITIAGVVFLSIMLNQEEGSRLSYSLNRILDTFVGIIVAVVVNYVISPPFIKDKICSIISNYIQESRKLLIKIVQNESNVSFKKINELYESVKKEYPIFKYEQKIYHNKEQSDMNINKILFLIECIHRNIDILEELGIQYGVDEENSQRIKKVLGIEVQPVESTNNLLIVYNYHIKFSLMALDELLKAFKKELNENIDCEITD